MSNARDEFLNLPFQEKLEFLYGLPAREKYDLILSAPEAERLVQSFAPQTLFYTLKEIGAADAGDLLSLAVPEQVRWLFDLDCWDKDRPNLRRMREWIEAMAEGGRERIADGLMSADMELVSLLLRQHLKVHRIDEPNENNTDAPSDRFIQFGDHYLIEFTRRDSIQQLLMDFLEEAFERDYAYFAGLMEEIYWGVEAELEEQAYQFRSSRLADHGFPDYYEAQSVFAYLNPRHFLEVRKEYVPPARDGTLTEGTALPPELAPTLPEAENSLFNTALMAGFAAQGIRQLRSEMALVSNQVLVARSVDFGDPDAVRAAVEMTHDYLNLALEHLAGGDLTTAIEHLRETHLKILFRLGVSLTIDLRKRAEATIASLGLDARRGREVPYLDSPYRETLGALLQRQPQFFAGLDNPTEVDNRNFRSMRDIHLGYAMLDQIESMRDLFRGLLGLDIASAGFRANVAGHEIRLSQILLTALLRLRLDHRLLFEPIEPSRLGDAHAAMMVGERPARLSNEFRSTVNGALSRMLDEQMLRRATPYIESCLKMLEEEFAELEPSRGIDARFLRSFLIRR
ncbi:MAG TPA: DUF6178 family protein [Candidatus Binataceae bacterium]|nr:DUF6178 family protein [Candidatus Binataceae bacterium]